MSLAGKTCIITGASSGLGFATAKCYAKLGANVVMVCRDQKKGKDAVSQILNEIPNADLELAICDLASMKSVKNFISGFKETHSKLDILFNNAAVWKRRRVVTEDNLETMFQVNYLAPVMLITAFYDLMKNSTSARIINIALPSQKMRLDFDNLQSEKSFKEFDAFFRTKLCLLIFSIEFAKRSAGTGISVYVTDPGPGKFKSNLTRDIPKFFNWLINLFSKPVEIAAETIVYLSTSNEAHKNTEKIFKGKKEELIIPYWKDKKISENLLTITESISKALK